MDHEEEIRRLSEEYTEERWKDYMEDLSTFPTFREVGDAFVAGAMRERSLVLQVLKYQIEFEEGHSDEAGTYDEGYMEGMRDLYNYLRNRLA